MAGGEGDLQVEVSRLRGRIGGLEGLVQAQAGAIEGLRRELEKAGRRIQALEQENRELARIDLRAGGWDEGRGDERGG